MAAFPAVKAVESVGVADQPTTTSPEIHILAAHEAYILDAIPGIGWGHSDLDHCHRRSDIDDRGCHRYRATGRQRGHDHGQTNNFGIFKYHA
jgi:hypothetical protein